MTEIEDDSSDDIDTNLLKINKWTELLLLEISTLKSIKDNLNE